MLLPLVITTAAGLAMLALIAGVTLVARRAIAGEGAGIHIGEWRFYPSPWVLIIVPVAVAVLFARFLPFLIFIPFIFPFFLRRGRGFGGMFSRRGPRDNGGRGRGNGNGSDHGRRDR